MATDQSHFQHNTPMLKVHFSSNSPKNGRWPYCRLSVSQGFFKPCALGQWPNASCRIHRKRFPHGSAAAVHIKAQGCNGHVAQQGLATRPGFLTHGIPQRKKRKWRNSQKRMIPQSLVVKKIMLCHVISCSLYAWTLNGFAHDFRWRIRRILGTPAPGHTGFAHFVFRWVYPCISYMVSHNVSHEIGG